MALDASHRLTISHSLTFEELKTLYTTITEVVRKIYIHDRDELLSRNKPRPA